MKTRTYYIEKFDVEGQDMFDIHVTEEGRDEVIESFQFEDNAISHVAKQMFCDFREQEK